MKIQRFHYITSDSIRNLSHVQQAKFAVAHGLPCLQLRMKKGSKKDMLKIAHDVVKICKQAHIQVIINDHVEIAKEVYADGVHLGRLDMDISRARQLLGESAIIGGTANTFDDIQYLNEQGVDYIGLGPYKFTSTKETLNPILGIEGVSSIIKMCLISAIDIPLIVVGGINAEDVKYLIKKGVHGIAVSSAINVSNDRDQAIKEFIDSVENASVHA